MNRVEVDMGAPAFGRNKRIDHLRELIREPVEFSRKSSGKTSVRRTSAPTS